MSPLLVPPQPQSTHPLVSRMLRVIHIYTPPLQLPPSSHPPTPSLSSCRTPSYILPACIRRPTTLSHTPPHPLHRPSRPPPPTPRAYTLTRTFCLPRLLSSELCFPYTHIYPPFLPRPLTRPFCSPPPFRVSPRFAVHALSSYIHSSRSRTPLRPPTLISSHLALDTSHSGLPIVSRPASSPPPSPLVFSRTPRAPPASGYADIHDLYLYLSAALSTTPALALFAALCRRRSL
ncbi:hypothetical protein R3P38DRAFT_1101067 [Favolaschia claudopus]|uniref:Uncharacterized protein n=1 Tax=Favolaschia claudopus TaxID=2862362 RepID=A0AAW0BAB2_9AGAR